MTYSLYTNEQRKSFVLAALNWLEKNPHPKGVFSEDIATEYRRRIKEIVPKGRDPLDWATEP